MARTVNNTLLHQPSSPPEISEVVGDRDTKPVQDCTSYLEFVWANLCSLYSRCTITSIQKGYGQSLQSSTALACISKQVLSNFSIFFLWFPKKKMLYFLENQEIYHGGEKMDSSHFHYCVFLAFIWKSRKKNGTFGQTCFDKHDPNMTVKRSLHHRPHCYI